MKVCFHHVEWIWTQDDISLQEKLADIMIRSVREQMPGCEIVQFTNHETRQLPGVDRAVRKTFKRGMEWLPFYNSFMQEEEGEILVLDSDLVVRRDLRKLRDLGADLVITVRKKPILAEDGASMWVLMGVCYSRSKEVWHELTRRVQKLERMVDRNWWGTQIVLWEMFQDSLKGETPFNIKAVKQWEFNYTPLDEKDAPDVWVIHYKGEKRKPWMLARWANAQTFAYEQPANNP